MELLEAGGVSLKPSGGLTTTEAGGQATFTVALTRQPTATVTLGVRSSDPSEGSVSPASVNFTPTNWSTPQTVTVTGVDDTLKDGNIAYSIFLSPAASSDPRYNGLNPPNVRARNTDND